MKKRKHSIHIEAVGSQIQIIGGSISPKEETWKTPCPKCGKWLKIHLFFDNEACEWSITIEEDEA